MTTVDMDCVPADLLETGITWVIFASVLYSALRTADRVSGRMAHGVQEESRTTQPSEGALKQACILLTCMSTLLAGVFCTAEALLITGVAGVVHFVIVGAVKIPIEAAEVPDTSRLMFWSAVERKLDPGILTGFLSKRLWSTHLLVALAVCAVPTLYVMTLESKPGGKEEQRPWFTRMFQRTQLSAKAAIWLCFVVVVLREFANVGVNAAFRHVSHIS